MVVLESKSVPSVKRRMFISFSEAAMSPLGINPMCAHMCPREHKRVPAALFLLHSGAGPGMGAGGEERKAIKHSISQQQKDHRCLKRHSTTSHCSFSSARLSPAGTHSPAPGSFSALISLLPALQGKAEFTCENRAPDSPESFSVSFAQERFPLQRALDRSPEPGEGRSRFHST